jgi:sec-independent protein translocase protein TatA
MAMPALPELLIIGFVVVLLFGTSKLPQLGGAIGESIKNFKKGIRDDEAKKLADKEKDPDGQPKA